MKKISIAILVGFIFLTYGSNSFSKNNYETIVIPCKSEECNPALLGPTVARWYYGDNTKPTLMVYGGGPGQDLDVNFSPFTSVVGKMNLIIVRSQVPVIRIKGGKRPVAFDKHIIFRNEQVAKFIKKKINQPLWLLGHSNGAHRLVGTIAGKTRKADAYAGLIFSGSPNINSGKFILPLEKIKYKLNMPVLIINHDRDRSIWHGVKAQKTLFKKIKKMNKQKTELILLKQGNPEITKHNGGHHSFFTNQEEYGAEIIKFILSNS